MENTNFSPSELKTLKKFRFDKEMQKKMVNFKTNYGVHKVEKAWQYFPLSDWLVKIMTSWERRRRHENFEDAEFELTQSVADESSRRRSAQSTRTKSLFTKLAMSVHSSALLCATGAWGVTPIGRVRVNFRLYKYFNYKLKQALFCLGFWQDETR